MLPVENSNPEVQLYHARLSQTVPQVAILAAIQAASQVPAG